MFTDDEKAIGLGPEQGLGELARAVDADLGAIVGAQ
jgi:hypothetical protein